MGHRYRQPDDEYAFEDFCLALAREIWARPLLERFGRRGQRQYGVDLFDTGAEQPRLAFQCKHHDLNTTLPVKELRMEVAKALKFPEKIDEYIVLTTAKKGTEAELELSALNNAHRITAAFRIRLLTWEQIQPLIDRSPAARQLLGLEADDGMTRAIRSELAPFREAVRYVATDAQHGELDEIKAHLDRGEPADALVLLRRVRRRSWNDLSSGQRARLCTLEGDARNRIGETAAAARALLEAQGHAPNSELAMTNAVAAHRLLGDSDAARRAVDEVLVAYPNNTAALGARIELALTVANANECLSQVPPPLRESNEVLIAVASRHDLGQAAEAAARRATELFGRDAQSWLVLGTLLLDREATKTNPFTAAAPLLQDTDALREARNALTTGLVMSDESGHVGVRVEALLRRSMASALLGDAAPARADAEEALRLAPSNVRVMIAAARDAESRGDHEAAISTLRRAVMRNDDDEPKFSLAVVLWNRDGQGDRAEAIEIFAALSSGSGPYLEQARVLAIEGFLGLGKVERATEVLKAAEAIADRVLIATLGARIETVLGNEARAAELANLALSAVDETTSRAILKRLAKVLVGVGRAADALPLLVRTALPGVDDEATYELIQCAALLQRHDAILEICALARDSGVYDDYLVHWELRVLDHYDPSRAMLLAKEALARAPADNDIRVHLAALAVRLDDPSLAREQVALFPPVTAVSAEVGAAVVGVLLQLGMPNDARDFAYDLLRLHFSDVRAHRVFRDALLRADRDSHAEDEPTLVRPGVAVCLKEKSAEDTTWVVLEDSPVSAVGVDNEVGGSSERAKLLLGRRVGDVVSLSDGPGIRRTVTIAEITSKLTFRVRDVMSRWQYRFPDQQEMWMVRVAEEDGKPEFSALFEMMEGNRRRTEEADRLYNAQFLPLAIFARILGRNEAQALAHLVSNERTRLRCCRGSAEEFALATTELAGASEVVLELSALVTLLMLGEMPRLEALGKALLVSHTTLNALRTFVADSSGERSKSRRGDQEDELPLVDGEPKPAHPMLDGLRFVEKNVTIVSSVKAAYLDPALRTQLTDVLGTSGLESAVIASEGNRVLLTDDGVLAMVAKEKIGVRRAWTQQSLAWLTEQGRLSPAVHDDASARLISWGYSFTRATRSIFSAAGRLSGWLHDRGELQAAIKYLALPEVRPDDSLMLGCCVILDAWITIVHRQLRDPILLAVLQSIGARGDVDDRALDNMLRALRQGFGLNVLAYQDVARSFAAWRASRLPRALR